MALPLMPDQMNMARNLIMNTDRSQHELEDRDENEIGVDSMQENNIQATHEYEMNQSESLTFLFNLLYDDDSHLSKSDVLKILNSLKRREEDLCFSVSSLNRNDLQGVLWPRGLKEKFKQDRIRIGRNNWFQNIPGSIEEAARGTTIGSYQIKTDFFQFYKFFTRIKLHITHFQLRNIVACSNDISNGIFYLSGCCQDYNSQNLTNSSSDHECQTYFKIDRISPDYSRLENSNLMKLDCYIDSRKLMYNANSRISTLSSSSKFLACGTFEGGYLLQDISNPDTPGSVIENQLTHNTDGITNHITIDNDEKLIIASNDKALRVVDITKQKNRPIEMPFAVNCSALNRHNKNEVLLTGDCLDSFIVDLRQPVAANMSNSLSGHRDYGFSCDWNPSNEHLLMTGNQDGCIRIWDKRRSDESINCFNGSLGSDSSLGGPIRNCKFSYNGDYIGWAESLDHAGVVELQEVVNRTDYVSRVQSIDFIGKCIGLNFCPTDNAKGEQLIIGVNDCPLGGILSYTLENRCKSLDFDFYF